MFGVCDLAVTVLLPLKSLVKFEISFSYILFLIVCL